MPFALFILVNALLFVRPAELVPALEGAPLYETAILACLVTAAPRVAAQLDPGNLTRRPLSAAMLGLLAVTVVSQLLNVGLGGATDAGTRYVKIVIYYLLLMAVVDTPARLRVFLGWVVLFCLVLTSLTLLQYHEVIDLPSLRALQRAELDRETGELVTFPQLCGMGIFNDPNDLSIILVFGMMVCLSRLGEGGWAGTGWLLPLGVLGYALVLTKSRGGFLALLGALAVLLVARLGARRAVLIGIPVLAGLVAGVGGRQTKFDLNDKDDTSQHRIRLWRDGLVLLRSSPAVGIGVDRFEEECGLVAHNSFVHTYTELGFLGGTLFLAAFVGPLAPLHRLGAAPRLPENLRVLRTLTMTCLCGLNIGMLSLTRAYSLTPYLVLGVTAVYFRLAAPYAPATVPRLGPDLVARCVGLGVAFLFCAEVFVRVFAGQG